MAGRPLRYGFTLIEMLVVIAVITIVMSMLLPAVQAAREAANRTQCFNQARELTLGIQSHLNRYKFFPGNGGDDGECTVRDINGDQVRVGTMELQLGQQFWQGSRSAVCTSEKANR